MHIAVQGRLRTRAGLGHTIRKLARGNGQRQAPTKPIISSLIRQPHLSSHRNHRANRAPLAKNATQQQIVVERSTTVRSDQNRRPVMQRQQLAACKAGQYRNPATGRCRALVGGKTPVAVCKAGYYRNPATGHCKKLGATNSRQLMPCKPGCERNPSTNRCRK